MAKKNSKNTWAAKKGKVKTKQLTWTTRETKKLASISWSMRYTQADMRQVPTYVRWTAGGQCRPWPPRWERRGTRWRWRRRSWSAARSPRRAPRASPPARAAAPAPARGGSPQPPPPTVLATRSRTAVYCETNLIIMLIGNRFTVTSLLILCWFTPETGLFLFLILMNLIVLKWYYRTKSRSVAIKRYQRH